MPSKFLLAAAFAASFAFAVPAFADDLLDGIGKMPGSVEDVRIGGTWEKDGKNGAYRVIITRTGGETVVARLFVQWIAYPANGDASVTWTLGPGTGTQSLTASIASGASVTFTATAN